MGIIKILLKKKKQKNELKARAFACTMLSYALRHRRAFESRG